MMGIRGMKGRGGPFLGLLCLEGLMSNVRLWYMVSGEFGGFNV
jgi:hypothetical protein